MRDPMGLVLAAIPGAAGGAAVSMRAPPSRASAAQPVRIAVLRLSDWLADDATPQATERAIRDQRRAVDRLVAEGYVVLNADAVFGAPDALMVGNRPNNGEVAR